MANRELNANRIDLWCASSSEIQDVALLQAYQSVLSETERTQQQRFYFARDRQRYLVTRALVRTVLSRYAAISPSQWVFSPDAYGKPHIANDVHLDNTISFNITHSGSFIILAVTTGRALGLDTENRVTRKASLDVAGHYFAPAEVADLFSQPVEQQQYRFFEYWTLKESYIKARGMGLSIPLDQFSFYFPDEKKVELAILPSLNDNASRWRFWQILLEDEYLVSVCAERSDAEVPSLLLRKVVPLVSGQGMGYELLRMT